MNNKIYKYLFASILVAGFASCDENTWQSEIPDGYGNLEMTSIGIDINSEEKVVTRATTNVNNFIVTITDNNNKQIDSWIYSAMPEIVTLPAGEGYKVTVESHEVKDAEWDNPYYKGEETFNIEAGKITQIGQVTAKFASLKVSVKFSDDLKSMMDKDAKVTVKGSNGAELDFTRDETRSGYFAVVNSNTMAAHFSGMVNGVYIEDARSFSQINAGEHHVLTYSISEGPEIPEQSGEIEKPGIQLDFEVDITDMNTGVNVSEDNLDSSDRPGKEDPQEPDDPNTPDTPDDPNEDNAIEFVYPEDSWLQRGVTKKANDFDPETGKAYLIIECPNKIKSFWVNIESDDPNFKESLEGEFNLKTNFDLADTSEENQDLLNIFDGFGFPTGDRVKGQSRVAFDISDFVDLLIIFEGKQTFTLTVTDELDNKESDSIIIIGK